MKKGKMEKNQPSALTPAILTLIHGLCNHFGKLYCFPSQFKIIQLMAERFNLKRSRRTLNRQLKRMEASGLIIRKRRIRRDRLRGMIFQSTLYEITLKGYDLLRKLNVNVWKQINILRNKMFNQKDRAQPGKEKREDKTDLTALKDILGGMKIHGFT